MIDPALLTVVANMTVVPITIAVHLAAPTGITLLAIMKAAAFLAIATTLVPDTPTVLATNLLTAVTTLAHDATLAEITHHLATTVPIIDIPRTTVITAINLTIDTVLILITETIIAHIIGINNRQQF